MGNMKNWFLSDVFYFSLSKPFMKFECFRNFICFCFSANAFCLCFASFRSWANKVILCLGLAMDPVFFISILHTPFFTSKTTWYCILSIVTSRDACGFNSSNKRPSYPSIIVMVRFTSCMVLMSLTLTSLILPALKSTTGLLLGVSLRDSVLEFADTLNPIPYFLYATWRCLRVRLSSATRRQFRF